MDGAPNRNEGPDSVPLLVSWATNANDPRPVIDKTGLTKVYDFTLDFMPELPPGVSIDALPPEMQNRPTILDALREQLGLRLESGKGPVENM